MHDFQEFLQTQLNDQQRAAVTHERGPILVIAGAGSGKTRIITARIAHLIINHHVPAHAIVALTFTNKAAQEMRERIHTFIGQESPIPFLGTFHAYCLRLLREHGAKIGLSSFGIIDEADQESIIKKILGTTNSNRISPRQARAQISLSKNNSINDTDVLTSLDYIMRDTYQQYEAEKKLSNCLDFDDLLRSALKLLRTPGFTDFIRSQVRHVLVDEYQDTNKIQHALLKLLALEGNTCAIDSLCVVGDEDQAIYSWRGATIENITQFSNHIENTILITIEQNYRSAKPILDAANHIISNNKNRHPKNLWSTKAGKNSIIHVACASDFQESELVAQTAALIQKNSSRGTCAVLYRAHFQSRGIEEALIRHTISYKIIGGIQFYERKEIKDILAYARLIANPFDRIAFSRCINCPPRLLGEKFSELFLTYWQQHPFCTYHEIAQKLIESHELKPQQEKNLNNFLSVFSDISDSSPAAESLQTIIDRSNYISYLRDNHESQDAHERSQNVTELVNAAFFFAERGASTINLFLQEVALLQERPHKNEERNPIQLMTIHAAKGLEFDTVMITGLEEGLFPSSKTLENKENIEEERRLLYVGITRAKKKLMLSWAENRFVFGSAQYQTPSRFLSELPHNVTVHHVQQQTRYAQEQLVHEFVGIAQQETDFQIFTAQKRTSAQSKNINKEWQPLQPVNHKTFGVGTVQAVEKTYDTTILTIQFKNGIKRIASSFVSRI